MKKITVMMLLLALAGCGSKESASSVAPSPQSEAKAQSAMLKNQKYIDQGMQYLQQANVGAAIKSFDSAIKADPRDPRGYLVLGQTYLRLQEYDRAIDTFSAVTKLAPQNGEGYYLLAVSYNLSGDKTLAKQNAEKSIEIFQNERNKEKFVRSVALLNGLAKE